MKWMYFSSLDKEDGCGHMLNIDRFGIGRVLQCHFVYRYYMGMNPGLHSEKLVTNHLSSGIAKGWVY
jgi:hypothetical protein